MFEVVIEAWNTLYNNGPNPQTQEHGECSVLSVNPQYAALESTELRIKSLLGFKTFNIIFIPFKMLSVCKCNVLCLLKTYETVSS